MSMFLSLAKSHLEGKKRLLLIDYLYNILYVYSVDIYNYFTLINLRVLYRALVSQCHSQTESGLSGRFPVSVSPPPTGLLIIVKLLPRCKWCNVLFILFAQMDFLTECQNLNL